jgi:predicted ATPase
MIPTFAIPVTLQDSLMSRLDRLMTGKVIAQLGATIGRHFSYALLQAVAQLDEVMLQHELSRLVEAEIIGSLVISGVPNYLIFQANKAYPDRSRWIRWNKCLMFRMP